MKNKVKLSIKTKMLTAFLALFIIALIVFGFIALTGISSLNDYSLQSSEALANSAVEDSTIALENQAKEYLLHIVKDQADISNNIFENVEAEIRIIAQYATMLLNSTSLTQKTLYSQQQMPNSIYDSSVFLLASNVSLDQVKDETVFTSNIDEIFKAVYANDPIFTQVFLGTESGICQLYPWTYGIDQSFDARTRQWFKDSIETSDVCWSEPYIDVAGHGLLVTCSLMVQSPQNNYKWVIGIDVTIATINEDIINTQIGELGYAFLLDNTGTIISHPIPQEDTTKWNETLQTSNLLTGGDEELKAIAQNMTQGKTGITKYGSGDNESYIAYAPLINTNWSVCLVLPVDEVIAPAMATKNKITYSMIETSEHINAQAANIQNIFIATFSILIFLIFITSLLLAGTIVKPIRILKKGAEEIGKGNLE
ncbi:MAG: serine/threonine protein phosphatase, partial [Crenarchaeota archaeon]|nr:serine/threonine protein phosphatase [Thermoproteota archaeon]